MSRMMFHNCKYGCCLQGGRAQEKRTYTNWLDEYESEDLDMCGVLPCCCIPGTNCER